MFGPATSSPLRAITRFLLFLGLIAATNAVAQSEQMPAEVRLTLADAAGNNMNARPITYFAVVGQPYSAELRGTIQSTATLRLNLETPAGVEIIGSTAWEGAGPQHAQQFHLLFLKTGRFTLIASALDTATGFLTRQPVYVVVKTTVAAARTAHRAAAITREVKATLEALSDSFPNSSQRDDSTSSTMVHIHGLLVTYAYSDGKRYPLRGVRVELYDAATNALVARVNTVEATAAPDCGLTPANFVLNGVWTHIDNSGAYDFGEISVSGSRSFYFVISARFYDGGDGVSSAGTEKLRVYDATTGNVIKVQTGAFTATAGEDLAQTLQMPALGSAGLGDKAAHVLYDLTRAYGHFRDCASFTMPYVPAFIDYSNTDGPYSAGSAVYYNGWTTDYLTSERTSSIYHEYSHSVQYFMRGGNFPQYPAGTYNHGGCANTSSVDGVVEGWARFVPVRLRNDGDSYYRWGSGDSPHDLSSATGENAACDKDEWTFGSILYGLWTVYPLTPAPDADFGRIALTFANHNPDLAENYSDDFAADWGRCPAVSQILAGHNVQYAACATTAATPDPPHRARRR